MSICYIHGAFFRPFARPGDGIMPSLANMLFSLGLAASITLASAHGAAAQSSPSPGAEDMLFEQNCAGCHGNPATRAPARASLQAMSPNFIVEALANGLMKAQGESLSSDQRIALAEFLTGKKIGAEAPMAGRCKDPTPSFSPDGPSFNGWGANVENWRLQPQPGVAAAQLGRLEPKWAFGVPGVVAMFGQPSAVGGRVFFGAQNGHVYSLDMQSGCYFWDYTAGAGVRTAVTLGQIAGRDAAFFGDRRGRAYAIDAATGETIWKVTADDDTAVQITGSPVLFEGRLYVPISVGDDSAAINPKFECCRGRGAIVALDAATGALVWKTYTLPQAQPQGRNAIGTQLFGPSGASIWASPTIDAKLRLLYVGTGDNHSAPATTTSDAVLAISLDTGDIVWSRQLLAGDMGNGACLSADKTNCPEPHGPDYDLGSSANLIALGDGKRLLTIGQKSGIVWALDPDERGRIVWQRRVGAGGPLGGVQWGVATNGKAVYAAVSDLAIIDLALGQPLVLDPSKGGGLHALEVATGDVLWSAPPAKACGERKNCSPAQSAAVTATPDFVLSGSVDGHIRAHAPADGRLLWDYDMVKPFETVNRVDARGGSLDSGGPTICGGMIFVNSGYGLYGGEPGNVLVAFAPRP
ncbi:PQQ-binding-like beta-propeller repeat protein [Rhodoblastus sp.]|jgi:polyvinyl alcohol dehydrogenase (cytochrome)|uniref:outer membrane protein assembly factor BamB family protein n=1 Tax=Rhodoblastus sp. TaxID=1962975 RepID=UPI0025ECCA92|nr:PQQ-binding-like beta-propeller repeat protein [Rhodoblastus sp.]